MVGQRWFLKGHRQKAGGVEFSGGLVSTIHQWDKARNTGEMEGVSFVCFVLNTFVVANG